MKTLKSLTFAPLASFSQRPDLQRRAKLVAHLQDQRALVADPLHARTELRWVARDDGVKESVEVRRRIRPWWRTDPTGAIQLTVRYGATPIEFEKGKAAIVVQDKAKLAAAFDMLIEAVKAGELDEQLAQHAKARTVPRTEKAA